MNNNDAYESILEMYEGKPFTVSKVADSLLEVLRFQFTPEEAELAVKVGLKGGKLEEIQGKVSKLKEKPAEEKAEAGEKPAEKQAEKKEKPAEKKEGKPKKEEKKKEKAEKKGKK